MRLSLHACSALAAGLFIVTSPAFALDLVGLNNRNELVLFTDKAPGKAKTVPVTGVEGKLLGIDLRPATKTLYGLSSNGMLYTIEGNRSPRVQGFSYVLSRMDKLLGYGHVP